MSDQKSFSEFDDAKLWQFNFEIRLIVVFFRLFFVCYHLLPFLLLIFNYLDYMIKIEKKQTFFKKVGSQINIFEKKPIV